MTMLELSFAHPVSGFAVLGVIIQTLDPRQDKDATIQLLDSEYKPTFFARITKGSQLALPINAKTTKKTASSTRADGLSQDILLLYSSTDNFELTKDPLTKRKDSRDIISTDFTLHYNGGLPLEFFQQIGARAHKVL